MMPGHDVQITVSPEAPYMASVKIDGVEYHNGVREYTIHHEAGERPTIVVLGPGVFEAPPPECDFDGMTWRDRAAVVITDGAAELLLAIGWTPPPGQGIDIVSTVAEKRRPRHG